MSLGDKGMRLAKRLMILLGIIPAFAVAFVVAPVEPVHATAAKTGGVIVARPAEIDFHKKFAGTRTYKRTKITNTGQTAVRLWIGDQLPDYFGYGGNPGQTCSYDEGFLFPPGASCYAVVRFMPDHGSPGAYDGYLIARAYEPTSDPTAPISTLVLIQELTIPILGETVCPDGIAPEGYCL
jgi:hypothetical protein